MLVFKLTFLNMHCKGYSIGGTDPKAGGKEAGRRGEEGARGVRKDVEGRAKGEGGVRKDKWGRARGEKGNEEERGGRPGEGG